MSRPRREVMRTTARAARRRSPPEGEGAGEIQWSERNGITIVEYLNSYSVIFGIGILW